MSASTKTVGYPVHALAQFSRWTNQHGARFTDWRALCGAAGTSTPGPFGRAGSARRGELCKTCFPFGNWEPARFIDEPVEVPR